MTKQVDQKPQVERLLASKKEIATIKYFMRMSPGVNQMLQEYLNDVGKSIDDIDCQDLVAIKDLMAKYPSGMPTSSFTGQTGRPLEAGLMRS